MDFENKFLEEKGLLTKKQVWKALGLNHHSWHRMLKEGLKVIQITQRVVLVKKHDLEQYLESKREAA